MVKFDLLAFSPRESISCMTRQTPGRIVAKSAFTVLCGGAIGIGLCWATGRAAHPDWITLACILAGAIVGLGLLYLWARHSARGFESGVLPPPLGGRRPIPRA